MTLTILSLSLIGAGETGRVPGSFRHAVVSDSLHFSAMLGLSAGNLGSLPAAR